MANDNCLNGMRCPSCGEYEPFNIEVKTTMRVYDNGSDHHQDIEWDMDSYCDCVNCGHAATVKDFTTKEEKHATGK